jgi:hypothetical protein
VGLPILKSFPGGAAINFEADSFAVKTLKVLFSLGQYCDNGYKSGKMLWTQ